MQSEQEKTPVFMGRWQPFHSGHFFIVKVLLLNYKRLVIGTVAPDPMRPSERYEKFHPANNPYSYWQRVEMIDTALKNDDETSALADMVIYVPIWGMATMFAREKTFLPPQPERLWVISDLKDDSSEKIEMLKKISDSVQVFSDVPTTIALIEATQIRKQIIQGTDGWKNMVPKGVDQLLSRPEYIEALRKSMTKTWPQYLHPH